VIVVRNHRPSRKWQNVPKGIGAATMAIAKLANQQMMLQPKTLLFFVNAKKVSQKMEIF
jgi:hypothetical protein